MARRGLYLNGGLDPSWGTDVEFRPAAPTTGIAPDVGPPTGILSPPPVLEPPPCPPLGSIGSITQYDLGPDWYPIAIVVTAFPCIWVGAALRTRRWTRETLIGKVPA